MVESMECEGGGELRVEAEVTSPEGVLDVMKSPVVVWGKDSAASAGNKNAPDPVCSHVPIPFSTYIAIHFAAVAASARRCYRAP